MGGNAVAVILFAVESDFFRSVLKDGQLFRQLNYHFGFFDFFAVDAVIADTDRLGNRNIFGYKIVDKVKELFPELTYKTIISRSSHIQEAPMYGKSVLEFAYNSRG